MAQQRYAEQCEVSQTVQDLMPNKLVLISQSFIVEDYDLYSPKMLANISGIEDVLEDRCITIILKRTRNKEKGNREIDITDYQWQEIRDKLYICLMQNPNVISVVSAMKTHFQGPRVFSFFT